MKLQNITMNFSGLTRIETLEGREHVVAPMVMLTEGVHSGSGGNLYYPPEELAKAPCVWNMKPVVVYHPTINGQGVSACDPTIISSRKVGVIMNAKFEDGKLKAEAWLEQDRMEAVDERISTAIKNQEMMELSTGVFTDNEDTEGTWNGEEYSQIARNYRPDHLALLPDKIGACSIADGAGFLRNEEGKKKTKTDAYGNMYKDFVKNKMAKALENINIEFNELSHSDIRSTLSMLIRERLGDSNFDIFIEAVFNGFFIYEDFTNGKFFQLGYTNTNDVIELSDKQSVEVVQVTEFKTVGGTFLGNVATPKDLAKNKETPKMNKKEIVDGLIANGKWEEDDREFLMGLEETRLEKLVDNKEESKVDDKKPVDKVEDKKDDKKPVDKVEANEQTVDQFIANAPAGMRDVLASGLASHNAEKQNLITVITSNEKNLFTPEALAAKTLGELKGIAALAAKPEDKSLKNNYAGMGQLVPVANGEEEEALAIPSMDFSKK